jgi:hypothetical protein
MKNFMVCRSIRALVHGASMVAPPGRGQFDSILDPLTAVFKNKTDVGMLTIKEGAPDASGDTMIVRRTDQRDLATSWLRHWI